jgi:hypothetical protein
MQLVSRSHLAAGVAFVGVGALAISPVAPPIPDVDISPVYSAATTLTASYSQMLATATEYAGALADKFLTTPAPILEQILRNQIANVEAVAEGLQATGAGVGEALSTAVPALLQTALADLGSGNVEGALNTLLTVPLVLGAPILELVPSVQAAIALPFQNLANVVNLFGEPDIGALMLGLAAAGLAGPLLSTAGAAGAAAQGIISALVGADLGKVLEAVVNAPATVLDGLLNGGYGPNLVDVLLPGTGLQVFAGGLLTPDYLESLGVANPDGSFTLVGTIATLLNLRTAVAGAITPPEAEVAELGSPEQIPNLDNEVASVTFGGSVDDLSLTSFAGVSDSIANTASTDKVAADSVLSQAGAGAIESTELIRNSIRAVPGETGPLNSTPAERDVVTAVAVDPAAGSSESGTVTADGVTESKSAGGEGASDSGGES